MVRGRCGNPLPISDHLIEEYNDVLGVWLARVPLSWESHAVLRDCLPEVALRVPPEQRCTTSALEIYQSSPCKTMLRIA